MVELRLIGGLGNQMSQVAFSFLLAKKRNDSLIIDISSYHRYTIRRCSIQKMVLDNLISFKDGDNGFEYKLRRFNQKCFHLKMFIKKKFNISGYKESTYHHYVNKGHYYCFESDYYGFPKSNRSNVDVYGYFQAERYFHDDKEAIRNLFLVKSEFISEKATKYEAMIKQSKNPIAISMRLQDDYLLNKGLFVCKPEYYIKAINLMNGLTPSADYYVFADDIQRAKELNVIKNAVFIEGVSDVEGIHLMRNCKNFIISNSSFSWWGSFLCENDSKLIVAPNRWKNNENNSINSKYYDNFLLLNV